MTSDEIDYIQVGKRLKLYSEVLGEDRPILLYLPDGYKETQDLYPVVYLLNGGYIPYLLNVTSTVELLASNARAPNMIVVGIVDLNHWRDWFPIKIRNQGGGASNSLKFITEELMPFINKNYRTAPYNILMGASNTGMFTVYSLLTKPEAFDAYIAVSPMLGWCNEVIHEMANKIFSKNNSLSKFLYMTYGSEDYEQVTASVPEFVKLLEESAPEDLKWKNQVLPDEGHVPLPWLYNSLKELFPSWNYPEERAEKEGLDGIGLFYKNLEEKYGFPVKIPEEVLTNLGYQYLAKEKYGQSIEVLDRMVKAYPHSSRAHYLLGVAFQRNNKKDKAINQFKKALEIEPSFVQPAQKLEELEKAE
ncbi:MAG: alpha/beta hydrolase-fold protein [Candidatus Hodarchaeota archaeon]